MSSVVGAFRSAMKVFTQKISTAKQIIEFWGILRTFFLLVFISWSNKLNWKKQIYSVVHKDRKMKDLATLT